MSGLNHRGRQRLRDHGATERLSALLAAAAEAPEEEGPGPGRGGGTPGPGDAPQRHPGRGGQHRHPVRVRHAMATPATVVLAAVLLIVCGLAAVSLTRGEPAATPVLEATARPVPTGPPPAGAAGESAVAAVPPPPVPARGRHHSPEPPRPVPAAPPRRSRSTSRGRSGHRAWSRCPPDRGSSTRSRPPRGSPNGP